MSSSSDESVDVGNTSPYKYKDDSGEDSLVQDVSFFLDELDPFWEGVITVPVCRRRNDSKRSLEKDHTSVEPVFKVAKSPTPEQQQDIEEWDARLWCVLRKHPLVNRGKQISLEQPADKQSNESLEQSDDNVEQPESAEERRRYFAWTTGLKPLSDSQLTLYLYPSDTEGEDSIQDDSSEDSLVVDASSYLDEFDAMRKGVEFVPVWRRRNDKKRSLEKDHTSVEPVFKVAKSPTPEQQQDIEEWDERLWCVLRKHPPVNRRKHNS